MAIDEDWGLPSVAEQPPQGMSDKDEGLTTMLDLVFILDVTGSMGSYIASATANIEVIVENILATGRLSSPYALRIGLIAYRDHPPQDNSFVTRCFPFSSDPAEVKEHLKSLYASGGGDGPEAVTAAMKAALDYEWRPRASRMCVLIADAPPHGLGEYGDGFSDGSPDGEDPLDLARQMANRGIAMFVVSCEPALSGYRFGVDLFRAFTLITSATLIPLTNASLLAKVIVGSAVEHMDIDRIVSELGPAIGQLIHSGQQSVDDVANELYQKLTLRNEPMKQLKVDSIYRENVPEAEYNVEVLLNSSTLGDAKGKLKSVPNRFTEAYRASRYNSYGRTGGYRSVSTPALPPRPSAPSSPGGSPGSPSRKVISDFKPFTAPSTMANIAETPLRDAGLVKDPEEELAQSVELAFQSISLDQAKRITLASAWRSAPPRA